jgi:hypothetical protein
MTKENLIQSEAFSFSLSVIELAKKLGWQTDYFATG